MYSLKHLTNYSPGYIEPYLATQNHQCGSSPEGELFLVDTGRCSNGSHRWLLYRREHSKAVLGWNVCCGGGGGGLVVGGHSSVVRALAAQGSNLV